MRPRIVDQRETLRRLTFTVAVTAAGLTAVLFVQTAIGQLGPASVQTAIISAFNALFPGARLRPPATSPSPAPGATPVVVSGGS